MKRMLPVYVLTLNHWSILLNSYKTSVLFMNMGKQYSPRCDAAQRRTRRPIWDYFVCLKTFHGKIEKKSKITPDTPKMKAGLPNDNNGQVGHMSRLVGKPKMWFPNRSDTNRPVEAQKRARSLKFRIYVEEELYYPSSENKGADQLRGYREADLRLCFRICKLLVFP